MKWLLKRACALGRRRDRLADSTLKVYEADLEKRLDRLLALQPAAPAGKKMQRVVKRFRQHLFVFMSERDIEPTNNGSERALRPCAVYRKITNGFRSEWGPSSTPTSDPSSKPPAAEVCAPSTPSVSPSPEADFTPLRDPREVSNYQIRGSLSNYVRDDLLNLPSIALNMAIRCRIDLSFTGSMWVSGASCKDTPP
jgi:hypothetical protein